MDYWSKLKLNECWSEKQRYNILLNTINERINGESPSNTSTTNTDNVADDTDTDTVSIGEVIVSVIDDDNEGVGNVDVSLSNDVNEYSTRTGSKGGCTLKNVEFGEYNVTASCDGYATYEDTITVDSAEYVLNIVLVKADTFTGEDEEIDDDVNAPTATGGTMIEEDGEF